MGGRYTEVALRDQADLILQMDVTWENLAGGGRTSARVIDPESSQVLYAGNRGGALTDIEKVGRQVVEDLQKIYQDIERTGARRR